MMPRYCWKLLEITLVLMGIYSTSCLKQCGPEKTVIFRNVGIKLCQLKCIESGQGLRFEYDVETLTCRLSRDDSKKIKKKEGYTRIAKNCSDVSCASKTCAVGQRCLMTRSGHAVCVQDGKQTYAEAPPKHDVAKHETANRRLYDACDKGSLTRVRRILSRSLVDINSRDKWSGKTPLMVAAMKGHSNIVDILLRKGANVSHVDTDGDGVLHWACRGGHVGMVKHLLSNYSVDPNRRGTFGRTPLMTTAFFEHRHCQVFDILVSMGANVSLVDDGGDSVLHWACKGGNVGMVKHLLSNYRVDINRRGKSGKTPLMATVDIGHREVFDTLLSMGANVSHVDDNGDNILHWACRVGNVGMVRYVLSQGVDINSRSKSGTTPLMTTVDYGRKDLFDALLSMGANVSKVDDNGDSALHWACRMGRVGMVKSLLSKYSVSINIKGKFGRTPLMTTVFSESIDLFKYLVGLGANASYVDDHGDNILHCASMGGHAMMIQHIISQDIVDINSRGSYGRTPLMRATYYGKREAFDVLVRNGCLTDLVDDHGETILHLACLGGRVEMVKYILSQNMADINAKNKDGETAAMIAKREGEHECYHILVSPAC